MNALIKAKIAEKRDEEAEPELVTSDAEAEPSISGPQSLKIPPLEPAAIQPEIAGKKVTVRGKRAKTSAKTSSVEALLAVLKVELRTLIDVARKNEQNGDQRPIDDLEEIYNDMPDGLPTVVQLFTISHRLTFLEGYSPHLKQEWSQSTFVRFEAALKTYDKLVRQFPEWQEFTTTAPNALVELPRAVETVKIAEGVIETLKSPEAAEFVEPALAEAFEDASRPFAERVEAAQNSHDGAPIRDGFFTEDFRRNIENTLKKLVELLLPSLEWAGRKTKLAWSSIDHEFDQQMKNAGPLLVRLAKAAIALTVGSNIAHVSAGFTPHDYQWIPELLAYLASAGVASGAMLKKKMPEEKKP